MVTLARAEAAGRVDVTRAVLGEPLPYSRDTFDRALCTLAIHHAPTGPPPTPNFTASCAPAAP